jgi:hypothetical protein
MAPVGGGRVCHTCQEPRIGQVASIQQSAIEARYQVFSACGSDGFSVGGGDYNKREK